MQGAELLAEASALLQIRTKTAADVDRLGRKVTAAAAPPAPATTTIDVPSSLATEKHPEEEPQPSPQPEGLSSLGGLAGLMCGAAVGVGVGGSGGITRGQQGGGVASLMDRDAVGDGGGSTTGQEGGRLFQSSVTGVQFVWPPLPSAGAPGAALVAATAVEPQPAPMDGKSRVELETEGKNPWLAKKHSRSQKHRTFG